MRHRLHRLLALLGAGMTSLAGAAGGAELTPFKIGISAPVVTILPVLAIFLALQKQYIQGLLLGSVKE